jgi:hypothetical protein
MSSDEDVAESNAASPPDAPILKIRAHAADSILGSTSFETARQDSGRRWPFLFERLLRFGPRAALAASLVGFMGVAAAYFSGGQLPFSARTPQPASLDGQQPGGERAEILRMVHQMADEIRALKVRVEAVHAQSTSAKEATALEGLKVGLPRVVSGTTRLLSERQPFPAYADAEIFNGDMSASIRHSRRGSVGRRMRCSRWKI